MDSKFTGLWVDQNNHHARISGQDGSVSVQFVDVPSRPEVFPGTETDPGIAAPTIEVNFFDVGQTITGALEAGTQIFWNNQTSWTLVSPVS
jgi:hypothetical protein